MRCAVQEPRQIHVKMLLHSEVWGNVELSGKPSENLPQLLDFKTFNSKVTCHPRGPNPDQTGHFQNKTDKNDMVWYKSPVECLLKTSKCLW